ncbi:MAG: hypothetical protein AAGI34_15485, partial [Pseudomonadota bacterium]
TSKLNAERAFLQHLFEIGRASATRWLDDHYDDLGQRSTVDIRQMFQGAHSETTSTPSPAEK